MDDATANLTNAVSALLTADRILHRTLVAGGLDHTGGQIRQQLDAAEMYVQRAQELVDAANQALKSLAPVAQVANAPDSEYSGLDLEASEAPAVVRRAR